MSRKTCISLSKRLRLKGQIILFVYSLVVLMGVVHTHDCCHCNSIDDFAVTEHHSSHSACDDDCPLCEFLHTAFIPTEPLALPVPVIELHTIPTFFIAQESLAAIDVVTLRGPPFLS